jgi:sensor histidine kinase YesM
MLITLVENAIKHGIEPLPGGGRIEVTAEREVRQDGAHLAVSVVDTGAGIANAPGANAIGLANIRERLALLYGEHATLETKTNVPRGFVARLVLPLEMVPSRAANAPIAEGATR